MVRSGDRQKCRPQGLFEPVDSKVRFPDLEERVLELWRKLDIQRRSQEERPAEKPFVFYEGPPTANGTPGMHHVLGRVFKDLIPRYKTMQGFRCFRKGGWDTHGLPVELEIEKELGLATKQEIEQYGIAQFNERCRESVFRYADAFRQLTERIGFWIDMDRPYITCDTDYIESCWWIMKQLWDRGLVYQAMKGTPHCPRCVTSLSSHEVALGYRENTADPSVYIKFRFTGYGDNKSLAGPLRAKFDELLLREDPIYFVAWTTTPWTLPANTGLAVQEAADYVLLEMGEVAEKEYLIIAKATLEIALRGDARIVATIQGRDLAGLQYEPLYDPVRYGVDVQKFAFGSSGVEEKEVTELISVSAEAFQPKVIIEPFVSLEDGTGIVHIAPAFGDEDLNAGRRQQLYFIQPVDLQGYVTGSYPFAGKFVKQADKDILMDLDARGLVYRNEVALHTYPFCWRCDTPLLYYAKASWYIRTTARKDRLVSGNEEISWYPSHIKEGRFGEWLRNNVDWAVSRERYWGTPMPIWQCQHCQAHLCIGSITAMEASLKKGQIPADLHRPYVDQVILRCPDCGGDMSRVPEVLDAWFDSGAMPFAQWHYPFEHRQEIESGWFFPADYICEMVEQTRGWFYSLHALSILLLDTPCYRNVIGHGVILDEQGEKMSKSRGNVVDPWDVLNEHGADAVRWHLITSTSPGNARRFSANLVSESTRRFLLPLWNVYSFFVTYANIDQFDPGATKETQPVSDLDWWIISELHSLIRDVTVALENYNATESGRRIQEFVELLSTWYVRRSRRRFWKTENDRDKASAFGILYECLTTLTRLMAPFTPFVAEAMYQNLVRSVNQGAPDSVHLDGWPEADLDKIYPGLTNEFRVVMKVVSLGRAARSQGRIRVRQPLERILVKGRNDEENKTLTTRLRDHILEELNVKEVEILTNVTSVLRYVLKPERNLLGPKYGQELPDLIRALGEVDDDQIATEIRLGRKVTLGRYELLPEEIQVNVESRMGYSVIEEGGYIVALETEISLGLAQEGLAREVVHRIQNIRRNAGFDVAERINTTYQGPQLVSEALHRFEAYVRQETLSKDLREGEARPGDYVERFLVGGHELLVGVCLAEN